MLPTSDERLSGVRNHWKYTCSEGNGLNSRTSSVRLKKTRARMPQTLVSHPGAKSRPPMVSSLCFVLVISLSIFGARTPRNSTHTSGMLLVMFFPHSWHAPCHVFIRYKSGSELVGELWCDKQGLRTIPVLDAAEMILRISTKHGETKSVHDGLLVREASKARKCSPQKFASENNISFGSILKTQSENAPKEIATENGLKNNGTKSTWASLFGTSSEGSLPYTPPKAIGDKVVVVPPEEVIAQGIQHLGSKPMLLRKWTPGIVPESFGFTSVPVWIKLGRIPMELWTEAGLAVVASAVGKPITLDLAIKERRRLSYARICVELDVDSHMPAKITCPRSVESKVLQEEVVSKIIPGKGDGLDSEPCGEVVLESFKQLEEGEIRSSPNRHSSQVEKEVGKLDEFTLVTRKKRELVSVRDRGKSLEVTMPNSFGSLLEVGDINKWALTIIEGSPPPL
ncbi:DUF4283 domain-containing protein [Cucumis melo var. makuwa]|uniref:DUF4283 domain-containing protein n=1 Tax=Cucumis melo var. makuwa TaxID=1194695 RepID=A0A5D3DIK9_CUCMM|nr:DUF4283 domain-containing protein [Cucumis melo var. makuwa]